MPIVHIELLEGRTQEQKNEMVKEVTEAIVRTTGAKEEAVSIVISDMSKGNYAVGGKTLVQK
ncbi:2-hydroxymuconate tautomerase [Vagococcus carniphilus]|uniref:Tautomerase n=1 Tax=Vagococcus carniphilus TaxID=218144 RepID=A0A430B1P6_9ENTE|nr:2-hydroxymuconate tautomerase [Vagococcus carniphilus]MDT2815605.1 4-oxalocrotonate tautomerase [Vagococcus carniphilus]MDT2830761.1 4-oxalocrotonate tautomerase [Vagococcus carniphilus]MDT2833064.1 4-oxalocrotonate tautomerase [Vagococcus carniphilus]MDT2839467.1 4-oxalocrotonate tautomerase [Vagococcus carniphilus]MDT2848514.1 4-oxalocrotonate tautomerase [Vagococcus carniphilus]